MGIRFEILFEENPNGMYFTGQLVKGQAIIYTDEEIPFKGIQLRVRGYAKVRWREGSGKSSDLYFDEQKYFDAVTECIDTEGLELNLNPGTHSYNFECALPSECPSSFEGLYGRIRYDTKIIVIRPRTFDKSYSMGFSVLKIFDLNQLPELRFQVPAKMEEFKHFCFGPCKSRPLFLSLELQRTSYVPGEFIEIQAKLVNNSSTKVEQVRVALNLVALYSVRNRVKTKTEKITIAKKKYGTFEKNILEIKENLLVPPTAPTCQDLCQIIKITYEVTVTAKVAVGHTNAEVSIPVIIGNIPFVEGSANISEDNSIANLTNGVAPKPCNDTHLCPPSYEEAAFVQSFQTASADLNNENKTHKTSEEFSPRYAFYSKMSYDDTENTREYQKE